VVEEAMIRSRYHRALRYCHELFGSASDIRRMNKHMLVRLVVSLALAWRGIANIYM
jgi:hypothetical protein